MAFTRIERIELPERIVAGEGFRIRMETDGPVPFAQCIVRQEGGREWIVRDEYVETLDPCRYVFNIPPVAYRAGAVFLQVEGCRSADLLSARPEDWSTVHCEATASPAGQTETQDEILIGAPPPPPAPAPTPAPRVEGGASNEPCIYFAIHKHMHQPYYTAADPEAWDGEKDEIFRTRSGPYTRFLAEAVRQYEEGGLAHGGLSSSWSGSLVEQLNRAAATGRCGGAFRDWTAALRQAATLRTALGHPRLDFTAFGFFHPLMPLIPARDVVGQIEWHRRAIRESFGAEPAPVLFPPETAFAPHMIPALREAGIEAVIFDSIHHFRACKGYPYAGAPEGMLPPNPSEQENFDPGDWLQLNSIWAPSRISPSLLKPCLLAYTDPDGGRHQIVGVPAERYLGNEDARGGYGALQYEMVMGQILDRLRAANAFDPAHPPFFVLHSDGDNHGGGAEGYYTCNTAGLVRMCQTDPRFRLISIRDYLARFPVDPANIVHVEPGAWAGADNGDPQFTKWFSLADREYSPDLNSWAVLTAFQNAVHALEDAKAAGDLLPALQRLLYTAETSCYWYWTGQEVWDRQVTEAAKAGLALAQNALASLLDFAGDITGPTIFLPWVRPANPGGSGWGPDGRLAPAAPEATVRTFIHDISGIERVMLHYREVGGASVSVPMQCTGPYPSRTGPAAVAAGYSAVLPAKAGDLRYYVEAVDRRGNHSQSPLGRIYIA